MAQDQFHCGENLDYMKSLPTESIDLIYSDILYGTGRDFGDYKDIKSDRKTVENFYIPRITEMHRLLKPTGSIYLQMDTRINHYVRLILEDVFGAENFRNEISWCYNSQGKTSKQWNKKHDVIIFFSKSNKYIFNFNDIKEPISHTTYLRHKKEIQKNGNYTSKKNNKEYIYKAEEGCLAMDWIYISELNASDSEKLDYVTQKPIELMARIIKASSNENDLLADFFCGSGSFGVAAKELNRNIILCDINPRAIELSKKRINECKHLFNN